MHVFLSFCDALLTAWYFLNYIYLPFFMARTHSLISFSKWLSILFHHRPLYALTVLILCPPMVMINYHNGPQVHTSWLSTSLKRLWLLLSEVSLYRYLYWCDLQVNSFLFIYIIFNCITILPCYSCESPSTFKDLTTWSAAWEVKLNASSVRCDHEWLRLLSLPLHL